MTTKKQPEKKAPAKTAAKTTANPAKKSIEDIAKEVKANKWGRNPERKTRLEDAGYVYRDVQRLVNKL